MTAKPQTKRPMNETEETPTENEPELIGLAPITGTLEGASATYSPEDNKLRLYPAARLEPELYARVKAHGFSWAPKQGLFVAPMWTPQRADLLIALCGEIGDEDKSLVERAEERADRFEDYSDKRGQEAEGARKAAARIADNIPFGQPILIGHHSERHARRDAEKIENGMRKAVSLWETSAYWTERAAGALHAAKYKERADVRARRIKKLESEERKMRKNIAEAEALIRTGWNVLRVADEDGKAETARALALDLLNYHGNGLWSELRDNKITTEDAACSIIVRSEATARWALRWALHTANRLTYERAMLGEQGGTVADQTKPEVGGGVQCWASPGYGKGWAYIVKVNRVTVTVRDCYDGIGKRTFPRNVPFDKLRGVMTKAKIAELRAQGLIGDCQGGIGFYVLGTPAEKVETVEESKDRVHAEAVARVEEKQKPQAADFAAMKDSLRAGVSVVTAPQLFPTPPELATRLIALADLQPGQRILEPSAGTGNLIKAAWDYCAGADTIKITALELSSPVSLQLVKLRDSMIGANITNISILCRDFLTVEGFEIGEFDRVIMNPPFADGADIKHIEHALGFLKPGGRLAAICANGPRQRDRLMPQADTWIDLPPGSFASQGTNVNCAICIFTA